MTDYTPGQPQTITLVLTDNNGTSFPVTATLPPGAQGASGDPSGCLPLSGGTINGALSVENGPITLTNTEVNLTGCSVYNEGFGGYGPNGGIVIGQSGNRGQLAIRTDSSGQLTSFYIAALSPQGWKEWDFSAGGAVNTPDGKTLMEATGSTGRPLCVQHFSAAVGNGSPVTFPTSFSSDDVAVIVPTYFDGQYIIPGGVDKSTPADRNGLRMA